jgi:hypothetical protein
MNLKDDFGTIQVGTSANGWYTLNIFQEPPDSLSRLIILGKFLSIGQVNATISPV